MKGIILHGGRGTRLRPLTFSCPKQLIPVANKPISQYVLEGLKEAGIREIAIVLGDLYPEKVKQYYGDGTSFGVELTYVSQGEAKGIAHAVSLCKDFVANEKFVVYLGDNLLRSGIEQFVRRFESSDALDALILLSQVKEPQRFGVAEFDNKGILIGLVEKPKNPPSNYALCGIYFFTSAVFEAIAKLEPSWRGELEITEAIQTLMDEGHQIANESITGWWKDAGKPEDIIEANRLVLDDLEPDSNAEAEVNGTIEGRVRLCANSQIKKGAKIRGPAVIGQDTIIESGVFIGPYTSVGDHCQIRRGEVDNSIIMEGCTIDVDDRITDSIIGGHSQLVTGSEDRQRCRRFVVGESSTVVL